MSTYLFTSESVTIGHPDKTADIISDSILDAILTQDPEGKVAVETFLAKNLVVLGGEVLTTATVDYEKIVRETIKSIGFTNEEYGLDYRTVEVQVRIIEQSQEINSGVFTGNPYNQGAGDQGIVFGFANKETKNFFPGSISLAHQLSARLTQVRENDHQSLLLPDGKTQVTLRYENGVPVGIDTVLVSTQHVKGSSVKLVEEYVIENVIKPEVELFNNEVSFYDVGFPDKIIVNPAGVWNVGSSASDAGLTGRKIVVDTYGGYAPHGGGAFSGKDPSKTDRSAAYAARQVAKQLVSLGYGEEIKVQIGYAIGVADPVSLVVTNGNVNDNEWLSSWVEDTYDLRPYSIIERLNLNDVQGSRYALTARNGHFGKPGDKVFSWE